MKKLLTRYISLLLLLNFIIFESQAQQDSTRLQKEVEVVKAYQPSISDAFKINDIPRIREENTEKPVFQYRITPQPVFSTFLVEPVQAAEIVGEPQPELDHGLLKLGIGNYRTPYGEIFYNTLAGEKTTLGIHFKHLSSHGKIKLENDDKVKAPQSENTAEIFATHSFSKATLTTSLFFDRQAFRYYGYTGNELNDEQKKRVIPFWNDKQAFSSGGIRVQLMGEQDPASGFYYKAGLKYQHFGSKTGQKENLVLLDGTFNKKFDQIRGRLDASLTYSNADSIFKENNSAYGERKQAILKLNPSILFETGPTSLRVGINSYSVIANNDEDDYMLAPNIKAEWTPLENELTLFAGTDGYLQPNHYSAIADENQFVNPYHNVKNAKYRYILTGGVRGKFTSLLNYKFQLDYSNIKNQHFYFLRNTEELSFYSDGEGMTRSNTFDVLYDKVKQLDIGGELHYATSEELSFLLKGTYHSYNLDNQDEAWNKPGFDASASLYYSPSATPFRFSAAIFYIGERKALIETTYHDSAEPNPNYNTSYQTEVYKPDAIFDLNFSIEYQYTSQLSFWGRVNNFSFKKYELWPGYSSQGLNLLLGVSYSF